MADPNGQGPVCKSGMRGFDSLPPLRRCSRLPEVAPDAQQDGHRSSKPAFAGSTPVGGAMPAKLKRMGAWLRTRRMGVRVSPRVPSERQGFFSPRSSTEERRPPKPGLVKVYFGPPALRSRRWKAPASWTFPTPVESFRGRRVLPRGGCWYPSPVSYAGAITSSILVPATPPAEGRTRLS